MLRVFVKCSKILKSCFLMLFAFGLFVLESGADDAISVVGSWIGFFLALMLAGGGLSS